MRTIEPGAERRPLRRNDVVMERDTGGGWAPFGRVWRRRDADHVEIIDCCKRVSTVRDDELDLVVGYQGYVQRGPTRYETGPDGERLWDTGTWTERLVRMATLRQLKRMASVYNPHFGGTSRWSRRDRADALAGIDVFARDEDEDDESAIAIDVPLAA